MADKRMTRKEAVQVMNWAAQAVGSVLAERMNFGGVNPDPRRNIDRECGYKRDHNARDYKEMYDQIGLAARIVNLLPDECYAVSPEVYETEGKNTTEFERRYAEYLDHPTLNFNYHFRKADCLSGVGRYGAILLGVNDAKPMSSILDGVTEDGGMTPARPKGRRLNYLRAIDESLIDGFETNPDPSNPRFGLPQSYKVRFESSDSGGVVRVETRDVHWSRVIHVAETDKDSSETLASPRLAKVSDQIYDVRKILGGSAEMFWKGGFPGIAATVDPRFLDSASGIEVDEESVSEEMQRYIEGLQRTLLGVGYQFNSLSPQVADPTQHLMMQFQMIAMTLGIPLRQFMGSEEAKLASGQDAKAWNRRIVGRQHGYLTPRKIRPFVHRLIASGVLPPTRKTDSFGFPVFKVFWPEVAMPDANETSTVADRRAAAMLKYVSSKSWQLMQPSDFLRFVLGYQPEEIAAIIANAKKEPEIEFVDAVPSAAGVGPDGKGKGPADSGVAGKPPSDSPTDAVK